MGKGRPRSGQGWGSRGQTPSVELDPHFPPCSPSASCPSPLREGSLPLQLAELGGDRHPLPEVLAAGLVVQQLQRLALDLAAQLRARLSRQRDIQQVQRL